MKILHVTPWYWPAARYGGMIRAVHGLCRDLAQLGHQVLVLTTNADGGGICDVPLDRTVYRDGVAIRYFPTRFGRRLYRSAPMAEALRHAVGRYDVVHVHGAYMWPGWAAARAAETAGIPYVISPHGMLVRETIEQKNQFAKRLWIRLIERHTLARAAAIHATSATEAEALRDLKLDLAPLIVIPNGVDLPLTLSAIRDDRVWGGIPAGQRLLYLGRVNWKKGIDRLILALPLLMDAVLIVAGNDEEAITPRLQHLAVEAGVQDRVHFMGAVEGERKWALLGGADLVVLPSLSENFGIVVLEALGVGTPVVVTPGVGAMEIVQRHDVGLVAIGDPSSLATALGCLLSAAERRRAMGERARKLVREHYSWSAVARQMEPFYAELAKGGRV